ncbi:MAG: hypothetical protein HOG49_16695, partial [Candidatus Scalindua sp.]|nr:hypothetical protein [Candidatus Scalindua sp.]
MFKSIKRKVILFLVLLSIPLNGTAGNVKDSIKNIYEGTSTTALFSGKDIELKSNHSFMVDLESELDLKGYALKHKSVVRNNKVFLNFKILKRVGAENLVSATKKVNLGTLTVRKKKETEKTLSVTKKRAVKIKTPAKTISTAKIMKKEVVAPIEPKEVANVAVKPNKKKKIAVVSPENPKNKSLPIIENKKEVKKVVSVSIEKKVTSTAKKEQKENEVSATIVDLSSSIPVAQNMPIKKKHVAPKKRVITDLSKFKKTQVSYIPVKKKQPLVANTFAVSMDKARLSPKSPPKKVTTPKKPIVLKKVEKEKPIALKKITLYPMSSKSNPLKLIKGTPIKKVAKTAGVTFHKGKPSVPSGLKAKAKTDADYQKEMVKLLEEVKRKSKLIKSSNFD